MADDPPAKSKSLDQQLLDELDSDLLDGLDDLPLVKDDDPTPADSPDRKDGGEESPLDQLGQGEDVELGQPKDPLTRIGERMQTAKELIGQGNISERTQQLQEEILRDLAALIAQQQQFSKSNKQGNPGFERRTGSRAGEGNTPAGDQTGPVQSTDRLGKTDAESPEGNSPTDLYREAWGKLPQRYIDQMLSSTVEEFLPEYAKMIEDYYIRLSEGRDR